jgi:hypothetical protein
MCQALTRPMLATWRFPATLCTGAPGARGGVSTPGALDVVTLRAHVRVRARGTPSGRAAPRMSRCRDTSPGARVTSCQQRTGRSSPGRAYVVPGRSTPGTSPGALPELLGGARDLRARDTPGSNAPDTSKQRTTRPWRFLMRSTCQHARRAGIVTFAPDQIGRPGTDRSGSARAAHTDAEPPHPRDAARTPTVENRASVQGMGAPVRKTALRGCSGDV